MGIVNPSVKSNMNTTLSPPGGSVWRKWDLHIHSRLSLLNNQFQRKPGGDPDWEVYIGRLETLDVSVIGITDYFTIDGFKKVRELKESGRLQNICTILPNIEFRLANVLASRRDGPPRRLNFHVIFSDEVSPTDIEEHFLHNLDFCYEASPQTPDQMRKLKVSNIEDLGKKLIRENQSFRESGESAHVIGAKTTVVNHEQITSVLAGDSRFKDKYLLVLPEELSSLIAWGQQDHVIRQVLLQKSDMVFSSNPRTAQWCLGQDPYEGGPTAFIKEFKSLKPCLHGSDAHDLESIARPCTKRGDPNHSCTTMASQCELRHCWIKADPTFEGLKQLKYEPADRVKVQQTSPLPLKSNACITGFRMEGGAVNDELAIASTNLPLNTGLVAVTGGKGTGKTALVDMLANFFVDRCHTTDPNSFVRRINDDKADFTTAITLQDGTLFEKPLAAPNFIEQSEVVYIAQGELEEYIGERSDLDKHVRELVFGGPEVKDSVKAFEFEKVAKKFRKSNRRFPGSTNPSSSLRTRPPSGRLREPAARRRKSRPNRGTWSQKSQRLSPG